MATTPLVPAVVAAVDDLDVVARRIVEGVRSSLHRSPFHGFSAEFSQHRAYRPGDDLKYLDWKLLARTDRLYTRQCRETTNLAAMLVVDTSASMAFPETGVSKFRAAVVMAAALAHLIISQGDSVGLMSVADGAIVYLPPKAGRSHLRALLARLARLSPAGSWPAARVIRRAAELVRRKGLLFVLSDLYDDEEGVGRELSRAAGAGHDVALWQTMSGAERTFPFQGAIELDDLESHATAVVDADVARRAYRQAVADFLARTRQRALAAGLEYTLVDTDAAPEWTLRRYLLRRGSPEVSHVDRAKA
jgi:uncharacterized protein (DUF58 family)